MSRLPRIRPYIRYVALAAVGGTTFLILSLRWMGPVVAVPSLWQPSLLFGATPALQSDGTMQPLALALALVNLGAILVEVGRGREIQPRLLATLQAVLAASLAALWSANLLTTLLCWGIYDLLQVTAHAAAGGALRTAVRRLIFGGLATLFLWGGMLLPGGEAGSQLWSLTTPSQTQLTLWAMAGALRLGLFPFHLAIPHNLGAVQSFAAPLSLGPIVGWGLWLRLALANGGATPGDTWLMVLAAISLGIGGLLAWSCESLPRVLSWAGMGVTGTVVLAAGLAGENGAAVVSAGSLTWALATGVVFLSGGLRREAPWWSIPSLIGALSLIGMPFTLGFVTEAALLGGLTQGGRLVWGWAFFFGTLFLVPALARWLLASAADSTPHHHAVIAAHAAGLGLPALLLIGGGMHPPLLIGSVPALPVGRLFGMVGLPGWLLWTISLAGGGVLAWQDVVLRPKFTLLLNAVHDLLGLEWLYDAVVGALDRGLSALRTADEVIGGGGALLWSWLLFLLLLLVWGAR